MRRLSSIALASILLLSSAAAVAAMPPSQPEQGPGGKDYQKTAIIKRAIGKSTAPVFVFHADSKPEKTRPVIVFFHSWGGNNPQYYGKWFEHLAQKGYLVLFPRFQEINRTKPADATAMASEALREALKALAEDSEAAKPDLNRVAYVGHLAGAIVALDLAAYAEERQLPAPKLILNLIPGGIAKEKDARGIPLPDLSKINERTLLITMSGDREHLATDRVARLIINETTGIPARNKLFMRISSDSHGFPPLSATLVSPGSIDAAYDSAKIPLPAEVPAATVVASVGKPTVKPVPVRFKWSADMALTGLQATLTTQLGTNVTDNLDYRGFWKTLDLAADAAFSGENAVSLKANPAFVDMGVWTDGWPVRRLGADIPKDGTEQEEPARRRRF